MSLESLTDVAEIEKGVCQIVRVRLLTCARSVGCEVEGDGLWAAYGCEEIAADIDAVGGSHVNARLYVDVARNHCDVVFAPEPLGGAVGSNWQCCKGARSALTGLAECLEVGMQFKAAFNAPSF